MHLPELTLHYRPPKGVRPPQLEGKRTGPPKGSKNFARARQDCIWGYRHRNEKCEAPNQATHLWQDFAVCIPDEVREYLTGLGLFQRLTKPSVSNVSCRKCGECSHMKKKQNPPHSTEVYRKWLEQSPDKFLSLLIRWSRLWIKSDRDNKV